MDNKITNHDTCFGKLETPKYKIKKNQKEKDTEIYVWVRTQKVAGISQLMASKPSSLHINTCISFSYKQIQ